MKRKLKTHAQYPGYDWELIEVEIEIVDTGKPFEDMMAALQDEGNRQIIQDALVEEMSARMRKAFVAGVINMSGASVDGVTPRPKPTKSPDGGKLQ